MSAVYTIDRKTVEGNRRVNYGHFTMSSGESAARSMTTGLRMVDSLEVLDQTKAQLLSGIVLPRVTYPVYRSGDTTVYPANDLGPLTGSGARFLASGNFTIEFTSTAGPILWKAVGKV